MKRFKVITVWYARSISVQQQNGDAYHGIVKLRLCLLLWDVRLRKRDLRKNWWGKLNTMLDSSWNVTFSSDDTINTILWKTLIVSLAIKSIPLISVMSHRLSFSWCWWLVPHAGFSYGDEILLYSIYRENKWFVNAKRQRKD